MTQKRVYIIRKNLFDGVLERKTYGSTESKSHVKVYIWKPVYSKEIAKRCCSETNISKSGHVSMQLFCDEKKKIPYDEKEGQYGYISLYPLQEQKCFYQTVEIMFRNLKSYKQDREFNDYIPPNWKGKIIRTICPCCYYKTNPAGGRADEIYTITGIDVEAIHEEWKRMIEGNIIRYKTFCNYLTCSNPKYPYSCSELVGHFLINIGGLTYSDFSLSEEGYNETLLTDNLAAIIEKIKVEKLLPCHLQICCWRFPKHFIPIMILLSLIGLMEYGAYIYSQGIEDHRYTPSIGGSAPIGPPMPLSFPGNQTAWGAIPIDKQWEIINETEWETPYGKILLDILYPIEIVAALAAFSFFSMGSVSLFYFIISMPDTTLF